MKQIPVDMRSSELVTTDCPFLPNNASRTVGNSCEKIKDRDDLQYIATSVNDYKHSFDYFYQNHSNVEYIAWFCCTGVNVSSLHGLGY